MRWGHIVAGTAIVAALLAPAGRAFAHATLVSTEPAAGAVLDTAPSVIRLTFDEAVVVSLADVRVFDQNAHAVQVGAAHPGADESVVEASVPAIGNGVYVVVWRVPSDDGHVIDGLFTFRIGPDSGVDLSALIGKVSGTAGASATVDRLDSAARLLGTIGLVVLLGGGVLAVQAREHIGDRPLLWVAWAALVAGSALQFGVYGAKVVAGPLGDLVRPSVWSDVGSTHTGTLLLVRLGIAVLVAAVLARFRHRAAREWRMSAVVVMACLVTTFAAVGHPYTQEPVGFWVAVDALHLAAMSVWIGGLIMLAFGARSWLSDDAAALIVRRFSVTAAVAVPVVVATGVAQTVKLAGGLGDLTATSWGRTLLVKIAIVTVLVAIGGVSQWLLRNDGPASLRRHVVAEALIGMAVLAVAASLVTLPPKVTQEGAPSGAARAPWSR
jgi:copper transport protein